MDLFDIIWIAIFVGLAIVPEFISKKSRKYAGKSREVRRRSPVRDFQEMFPEAFPKEEGQPDAAGTETAADEPGINVELYGEPEAAAKPAAEAEPQAKPVVEPEARRELKDQTAAAMRKTLKPSSETGKTSIAAARKNAAGKAHKHRKETETDKLKIDPREMIIYSALMEPKFKD